MIELRPITEENLFLQAISKFALGLIGIALLLFLPAGTFHYWNGWLLIAILFVPMFFAGIVMMLRDPELLKKRLNAKEDEAVLTQGLDGYQAYREKVKYKVIPFIW